MTIDETVKWFNSIFDINKGDGLKKNAFICGLTSDIERFKQTENVENLLGSAKCDSIEVAHKLVERMEKDGFSITKGQDFKSNISPIWVCMYKKNTK